MRVESTVRRPRCPHCGFKCHRVHDTREHAVRDLEVSGRRTTLVWVRRRLVCGGCDSRWLEEHPEFDGRLTRRLAQRLVADAQVMTIRAVVRRHGVSWPSVNALVRAWSGLVAEHRRSRRCRVLLVDETSMRKRHRYVTVIVNADTGRTLAMVEHRSSAALSAFLMSQGHTSGAEESKSSSPTGRAPTRPPWTPACPVPATCWTASTSSDGSVRGSPRRAATSSAASPTASSPPSTQKCSEPGSCCCGEATPSPAPTRPASTPSSTRTRGSKPAGRPYRNSTASTLANDHQGALEALGRFCDLYQTGELPEYHNTVDTFIAWSDEILAWHHTDRASNGRIEGTNNLLQVLRRTAHGFTNPTNFEARGILVT